MITPYDEDEPEGDEEEEPTHCDECGQLGFFCRCDAED